MSSPGAPNPALAVKTIKDQVGRAKSYASRGEAERAATALASGLKLHLQSKLIGREKSEVDALVHESARTLLALPEIRKFAPNPAPLKRGEERQLFFFLAKLVKDMGEAREKADRDSSRIRLKVLDQLMLEGVRLANEGKHVEAKRSFRNAVEQYPDVPGVASDAGMRMVRAGYFPEAVDVMKVALERDPRDIRAFGGLATAFEGIGHFAEAEETLREAMKQFGGRGRIHYRLAKVMKAQGRIMEAFNAVRAAVSMDPDIADAHRLQAELKELVESGQAD